jgi:hypothetical protein
MSGPVALGVKIGRKIIREEKKLENGKQDEQFYGNDFPHGSAYHHGAEAVSVKKIQLFWQCVHACLPLSGQKEPYYSVVYGGHLPGQIIFGL